MSPLDILLLGAGLAVMLLVIGGMFLLTPGGTVEVTEEGSEGQGSDLRSVHPSVF